jgi:hypothetical protein
VISSRVADRRPAVTSSTDEAESLDDLRSFVTLSRTHPTDSGDRHVFVKLDETKVRLSYGETFTAELKPGAHDLRAHNTLMWKTVKFTLEPAEHLEFVFINRGRWWTWGVAGVLGSAPLFLSVAKRSRL